MQSKPDCDEKLNEPSHGLFSLNGYLGFFVIQSYWDENVPMKTKTNLKSAPFLVSGPCRKEGSKLSEVRFRALL